MIGSAGKARGGPRRWPSLYAWVLAGACAGLGPVGQASDATPAQWPDAAAGAPAPADGEGGRGALSAHVEQVALRHSAEGLRKTYLDRQGRRKDGMLLPRIIIFNGEGRLLGGQAGFRTGDMRPLRRMVHENRPFPRAADLEDTLAELETPGGAPVLPTDLPQADAYVIVYRTGGCERCDRLDAELAVVLGSLHRHRFAWLLVQSDPADLDPAAAPAPAADSR